MEISGLVFRSIPSCFSGAGIDAPHSYSHSHSSNLSFLPPVSRFSGDLRLLRFSNSGFGDNGHIEYYSSTMIRCGTGAGGKKDKDKSGSSGVATMKKKLKKKMKLLKGLSEDLTVFSDMGFGLGPHHGLVAQVKGKMISDASELLLAQLQKLKAEEKELKRKKKEEKAKLKMQNRLDCEAASSSSSCSSESSDSECGEVIEMSRLKKTTSESPLAQPVPKEVQSALLTTLPNTLPQEGSMTETVTEVQPRSTTLPTQKHKKDSEERGYNGTSQILEQECCTSFSSSSLQLGTNDEGINSLLVRGGGGGGGAEAEKKIEVCMGGKCKKSGAPALLEEFQRMVGVEGAVVGCKCMGKCRDGPNVRVLNHLDSSAQSTADDSSVRRTPNPPLCIGVGLADVGFILSNFFGEVHNTDLAAAS